ncbi:MAG: hypothetical protein ACW991_04035 [Candidatus Hodarchaeales archaeon]
MVHTPDNLQKTLDYLNYSGVVFYRDNEQFTQEKQSQRISEIPVTEKIPSIRSTVPLENVL